MTKPARKQPAVTIADTIAALNDAGRDKLRDHILSYTHTDMLFYRDTEGSRLEQRQQALWQPHVAWAEARFGVALTVTHSVMPIRQAEAYDAAVAAVIAEADDTQLVLLSRLVLYLGSLILAISVLERAIPTMEALAVASLEQDFQLEVWGEDEEILTKRQEIAHEMAEISGFLDNTTS